MIDDTPAPIAPPPETTQNLSGAEIIRNFVRTLPAAPRQAHCLRPRDHGLRHLGHLDWFRQSHQSVWPLMAQAVRGEALSFPVAPKEAGAKDPA